jgi:hypothetical protein
MTYREQQSIDSREEHRLLVELHPLEVSLEQVFVQVCRPRQHVCMSVTIMSTATVVSLARVLLPLAPML